MVQGPSPAALLGLLKLLHNTPVFAGVFSVLPHGVLEGEKRRRQMDPHRHVLTFPIRKVHGIMVQSPEGSLPEKRDPDQMLWIPTSRDIYLQLVGGKCNLDAKMIKSNQKLEVNTKIMHAFMISIFIYSLYLKVMSPTASITQPLHAYPVLSALADAANISSIMYVV